MSETERDPIEYLINAMEDAGQKKSPFQHGYYDKRLAVLAAIKELRTSRNELAAALREFRYAAIAEGWLVKKDKLAIMDGSKDLLARLDAERS